MPLRPQPPFLARRVLLTASRRASSGVGIATGLNLAHKARTFAGSSRSCSSEGLFARAVACSIDRSTKRMQLLASSEAIITAWGIPAGDTGTAILRDLRPWGDSRRTAG